jgi:hypothetical protein
MGNWSNEGKMSYEDFRKLFRENICSGWAGENPGGGRSTVLSVSDNGNVCYQRKNSKISVDIRAFVRGILPKEYKNE